MSAVRMVFLGVCFVASSLAAAPPAVERLTAEALQECRKAGGTPRLGRDFETRADLDGDGQPDYLLAFHALECAGAYSLFCGSAGCPLSVFLSSRSWQQVFGSHVQEWSLEQRGGRPVLVLSLHGSACGVSGFQACERRLAWNGREFAEAPRGTPPARSATPAVPARPARPAKPSQPASPAIPTWSLGTGLGSATVATVDGPGAIRSLSLFCHAGAPWLAVVFNVAPPFEDVDISFASPSQRIRAPIAKRAGGGETWYADLRQLGLVRLLAGADSSLTVAINDRWQGDMSLRGSTSAVRSALHGCMRF